jgi:uncharacterized protein
MTTKKPSTAEEEYIAREEAQRTELRRIEQEQAREEAERRARMGTCPRGCATKLIEEPYQDFHIDRCPTCGGVWLDPGELEHVATDNATVVRSFFNFLSKKA